MTNRRILVLETRKLARLWQEGQSLVVRPKEKTPLRFPFLRVDAIYVIGPISRGLDALLGAAEAGIPSYFFGGRGKLKASLMQPGRNDGTMRQQLEFLHTSPGGPESLVTWIREYWRHELSLLGVPVRPDTEPDAIEQQLWPQWLQELPARKVAVYRQHIAGWQYARVSTTLRGVGLNPETRLGQWVAETLADPLTVMVMAWLGQQKAFGEPSTERFYQDLAVMDEWLKARLAVWFLRLELALDEWRDGVA